MHKPQELTDADRAEAAAAILKTVSIAASPPTVNADKDWPSVEFAVTLSRNGRAFWTGPFRFGVGHFTPTQAEAARLGSFHYAHKMPAGGDNMAAAWARKPHANFTDKALQAAVAADVARLRKFSPAVSDVLSSLMSDGSAFFDAQTFDDWCGDFGYDSDIRKAFDTFTACDQIGRAIARAFTTSEIETLRAWAQEQ